MNWKRQKKHMANSSISKLELDHEAICRKLIAVARDGQSNNGKGFLWKQNHELIEWDSKKMQIEARMIANKNCFKLMSIQPEHLPLNITPENVYTVDRNDVETLMPPLIIDVEAKLGQREAALKLKVNNVYNDFDTDGDTICANKVAALVGTPAVRQAARIELETARDEKKATSDMKRREAILKIDLESDKRSEQINREVEEALKKRKEFEELQQSAVTTLMSSIDEQRLKPFLHDILAFKLRKAWIDIDVSFRGNADSTATGGMYRKILSNYKYYTSMNMVDNIYVIDTLQTKLAQYNMIVGEAEKLAILQDAIRASSIVVDIKLLAASLSVTNVGYQETCNRLKMLYEEMVLKGLITKNTQKRSAEEPPQPEIAATSLTNSSKPPASKKAKVKCTFCHKEGHLEGACWKKHPDSRPECSKCGKSGHLEAECYKDATCQNCGKKGHTEKVCFRKRGTGAANAAVEGL